jgi:Cu/Ag efflux pump CusA
MRSIFTILSLLLTLGIVGIVAKKQLASVPSTSLVQPASSSTLPTQSPQEVQQQFKQALDAALEPAKREADEK